VNLASRWQSDWCALGVPPPEDRILATLLTCYAEPHRAYHNLRHLEECFGHLEATVHLAMRPGEVAVALWFHDAIYDTHASDNEIRSAEWARKVVEGVGGSSDVAERVRDLILATRHAERPAPGDAALLVDIDLAILGAAEARFDEYERQIRREYAWVPEPLFRATRSRILGEFLARPRIYSTSYFAERHEGPARANLRRAIAQLGG
jgi:predicted metal-dependent HD superfamily phosphohydrolase